MTVPTLETDFTRTDITSVTTSHTATRMTPAPSSGDLLVILIGLWSAAAGPEFADDVTGWTFGGTAGNSTTDSHLGMYYKISNGAESGTETLTSVTSGNSTTWYLRFTGVDETTPINVSNFWSPVTGNTTSHVIPGVTTDVDDCLPVYMLSFFGGDGAPFSVGSGWTESDEIGSITGLSACFGTKDSGQPTAGATGDATVTSTGNDGAAGVMFAVAPSAATTSPKTLTLLGVG